ncbi:MAG: phospho-sugar mutase [Bacteroidetes bacterium]|nr:phospho-sugar mutase [Bacteroidota bacterium]
MDEHILEKAKVWTAGNFDEETKCRVKELIESNPAETADSFYRILEFGTGGLRGVMGDGTNRMNKYTVGMATQGLANYVMKMFPEVQHKMAIAHDSRNNSRYFASITAEVLAANGFIVYLFDDLRPTPELSFAVRQLGCQSGVMITASHNPKEYNGYKAYWDDGAQFIAPHDENVIKEVESISSIDQVRWQGNQGNIISIGREIDEAYLAKLKTLSLSPDIIRQQKDLKIVYTPLHGTGRTLVPEILKRFGFENIHPVQEQMIADGNFPTIKSPNPEEHSALDMAIQLAEKLNADLVMATDPDADRVGIAVRDNKNKMILLNGNQTAALLFYYVITKWKENGRHIGKQFIVKTIVTTELLKDIAISFNLKYYDVLTGFKYIADIIRQTEGREEFIIGGEESYGYLAGDFVRDKDAVGACALIAETLAWTVSQGKSLYDLLLEIYVKYGFYKESLLSVTRKGQSGAMEIKEMMIGYRANPPKEINGSRVVKIKDYDSGLEKDLLSGKESRISLHKSNVLQFFTEDGSVISVRPSGTEPKIKFYFGIREKLSSVSAFEETDRKLNEKLQGIIRSLNIK